MSARKRKTIVYIDGFNLFHALKESKLRKYYWLDIQSLSLRLMSEMQRLLIVKYFTSRVTTDPNERKRQNTYLEALETLKCVEIQYGKFTSDEWECFRCHETYPINHEKQTDVNIAVSLLVDAQEDHFDDAILISADSDLVRPVRYINESYPHKRMIVGFPPGRHSADLAPAASKVFHIGANHCASAQLPQTLLSKSGYPLERPMSWQ